MPAEPASRPWRRFLLFSVRGLILLVIVVGAGFGWLVRQAQIQRDAVAAIRKAGGTVAYSWEPGKTLPRVGRPWAPGWLVDLVGVDYFGHVTDVNLFGSSRPAATELAEVGRLNQLESLTLNNAPVTDAEMVYLNRMTALETLDLGFTHVTDAGLVHLKALTKLSGLELSGTQVTDVGLVHLKGLTKLSDLVLNDTRVTDAGLVHLKGLTNLSDLRLWDTQVTDSGLVNLKELTNLSVLRLGGTQVTNAGISELKRALPSLTIYH